MRKLAVVAGAASGQGADVARSLALEGYAVALLDVDEQGLESTAAQIRNNGGQAYTCVTDIRDRSQVENALAGLQQHAGPPWVVAVAAAVLEGGMISEAPEAHWRKMVDINFLGLVHVNAAASKLMMDGGCGGRILNWSSLNAVVGGPGFAAYSSTKAAVEMFSKTLALELAPHGITVNIIRPGSIMTPMMKDFDEQGIQTEANRIPLGRWGTPADISAAVRYLVSEEASWITGSVLTIDGGGLAAAGTATIEQARQRIMGIAGAAGRSKGGEDS